MAVLRLAGSIIAGPVGTEGSLPAGVTTIAVSTALSQKPVAAQYRSGGPVTAPAFAPVLGIGSTADVKKCDFLYFKCDAPMSLRLTTADPAGGADVVAVVPVHGLVVLEFPSNGWLKVLELKGSGNIEVFASSAQS